MISDKKLKIMNEKRIFIANLYERTFGRKVQVDFTGAAHTYKVVLSDRILKASHIKSQKYIDFYSSCVNPSNLLAQLFYYIDQIAFFEWFDGIDCKQIQRKEKDIKLDYFKLYGQHIRQLNDLDIYPMDCTISNMLFRYKKNDVIYCDSPGLTDKKTGYDSFFNKFNTRFKPQWKEKFYEGYNRIS